MLLDRAKYILDSPIIKRTNPIIEILFNDKDKKNSDNLTLQLKKNSHPSIKIHPIKNLNFQSILFQILSKYKNYSTPKFFFLDPFTYSDVTLDNLRDLMFLPKSEVFLFIPVFHSYRFSSNKDFQKNHKTRQFVEEFTTKGMANYDDIDDFMQSIKEKIKEELGLDYVRPILLDDGTCKNAIFLLTKHQKGMLLMNQIALKESNDGKGINIKSQQTNDLFGYQETQGTLRFDVLTQKLEQELKNRKIMTNDKIIDFSIKEEFLPKHAKNSLKAICKKNKIVVEDENGNNITEKQGKWNIAEKITKNIRFIYVN